MWEATFPMPSCCPPFGYMALSHLACILMPLYSFVLQLPSPSHCVWCQLDKFSFFFSPFILNLCRTISTAISLSPPPSLAHTGHTPSLSPPTPSLPPQHCCYLTNVAVTTAAMPPLTPTLTCIVWHKNHPAAITLTVPGAT